MPRRPDSQAWRYWRTVLGVLAAAAVLVIGVITGHVRQASADDVDCSQVKCVALTFDDGPGPFTDRLLQILTDNDARSTFFLIGNKVAANPPELITTQLAKVNDAIKAATGQRSTLYRPAGGLSNDAVRAAAKQLGWPKSSGTSSLSTGSTTPTPRPPATC